MVEKEKCAVKTKKAKPQLPVAEKLKYKKTVISDFSIGLTVFVFTASAVQLS